MSTDVQGSRDRLLDVIARVDDLKAEMGDALAVPSGRSVQVTVNVGALVGAHLEMHVDGKVTNPGVDLAIHDARQTVSFDWHSDGHRHWIRLNVRGAGGELLLVGNPVYVNG